MRKPSWWSEKDHGEWDSACRVCDDRPMDVPLYGPGDFFPDFPEGLEEALCLRCLGWWRAWSLGRVKKADRIVAWIQSRGLLDDAPDGWP